MLVWFSDEGVAVDNKQHTVHLALLVTPCHDCTVLCLLPPLPQHHQVLNFAWFSCYEMENYVQEEVITVESPAKLFVLGVRLCKVNVVPRGL